MLGTYNELKQTMEQTTNKTQGIEIRILQTEMTELIDLISVMKNLLEDLTSRVTASENKKQ